MTYRTALAFAGLFALATTIALPQTKTGSVTLRWNGAAPATVANGSIRLERHGTRITATASDGAKTIACVQQLPRDSGRTRCSQASAGMSLGQAGLGTQPILVTVITN